MPDPRPIPLSVLNDTPLRDKLIDRVVTFWIWWPEHHAECWRWKRTGKDGYARLGFKAEGKTKSWMAHRLTYAWRYGDTELHIDHLCRNKACVNPDHLEAVTPRVNTLRNSSPIAENARKTHCKRGHSFDEKNTWYSADGEHRICKACFKMHQKAYNERINLGGNGPGTRQYTMEDMKRHCKNGHPRTSENLINRSDGRTECLECQHERRRQAKLRQGD